MDRKKEVDMLDIFQKEKLITGLMLAFLVLSIFIRVMLGFLYRQMIKEADNMATTENKLLKQCKLKFANCFQLNHGVANIPIFVDKFLSRLAIGPFSFETLYHISGQFMLLSVVSAGIGICKSIVNGSSLGEILPFYIVSFLGLYIYFSVSTVVDVKGKRRVLKVNLIDYLENHLSSRIDITENDMDMLFGRSAYGSGSVGARTAERSGIPNRRGKKRTVELMLINGRLSIEDTYMTDNMEEAVGHVGKLQNNRYRYDDFMENADEQEEVFTKADEKELEELLKEFLTM